MKEKLGVLLASPAAYVLLLSISGSGLVVSGVGIVFGLGVALVCAGAFLLLAANFVMKGMGTNG